MGSNPLTYVDRTGLQVTQAQAKAFVKANLPAMSAVVAKNPALQASLEENLETRLPTAVVRLSLNVESAELHQKRFKMIDDVAKPFVEINISTGEVKLSPGLFKQFTVREGSTSNATTGAQAGATNGSGGPAVNATGQAANAGNSAAAKVRKPLPPLPQGGAAKGSL